MPWFQLSGLPPNCRVERKQSMGGTSSARAAKKKDSREALMRNPTFAAEFRAAKKRISRMSVRYVEENDQLRQAPLEIYVHVALQTRFNDFDTH